MKTYISGIIVALVVIIGGVYFYKTNFKGSGEIACTMEAKICPDGSAVGRTGPNCEFAACPAVVTVPDTGDVTLAMGQSGTFQNLKVTLNTLTQDSRCPIDVVCIQAGSVNVNVTLSDGSNTLTKNISSSGAGELFGGYSVSITKVDPPRVSKKEILSADYRVTFHIEKQVTAVNTGTLDGVMTIGPICPVERIDNPCRPTAEMFAARKVFVYNPDKKTLITTLTPDAEGKFIAKLGAGDYWIDMAHQGIGATRGVPVLLHIAAGGTTPIAIDVDTGIR
ncbi:MAG: hypothetical protein Q7K44_01640 [Candidatus Liptonbacteria bacterium]|nr:hypothetical protein [Candidatus Liptonbacteria bacterium]